MQKLFVSMIEFYQMFISPLFFNGVCKYEVNCSEYTRRMVNKFGILKGAGLGVKRIGSCK